MYLTRESKSLSGAFVFFLAAQIVNSHLMTASMPLFVSILLFSSFYTGFGSGGLLGGVILQNGKALLLTTSNDVPAKKLRLSRECSNDEASEKRDRVDAEHFGIVRMWAGRKTFALFGPDLLVISASANYLPSCQGTIFEETLT